MGRIPAEHAVLGNRRLRVDESRLFALGICEFVLRGVSHGAVRAPDRGRDREEHRRLRLGENTVPASEPFLHVVDRHHPQVEERGDALQNLLGYVGPHGPGRIHRLFLAADHHRFRVQRPDVRVFRIRLPDLGHGVGIRLFQIAAVLGTSFGVTLREGLDQRPLEGRGVVDPGSRLTERAPGRRGALFRHDRIVVVRPLAQRDAPPGHGAVRVELGRTGERPNRLVAIEGVHPGDALVEVFLGLGGGGGIRVPVVAHPLELLSPRAVDQQVVRSRRNTTGETIPRTGAKSMFCYLTKSHWPWGPCRCALFSRSI